MEKGFVLGIDELARNALGNLEAFGIPDLVTACANAENIPNLAADPATIGSLVHNDISLLKIIGEFETIGLRNSFNIAKLSRQLFLIAIISGVSIGAIFILWDKYKELKLRLDKIENENA